MFASNRLSKEPFHILGLPFEETQYWQNRLSELQSECGCRAGAVFLLSSIVVYIVFLAVRRSGFFSPWWLGGGFVVIILAALLGKALAIGRARWILKRDIARLKSKGAIVTSTAAKSRGQFKPSEI